MADIGTQALYALRQSARVGFFLGNRFISNRIAGPVVRLNQMPEGVPPLRDLLRDIGRLCAKDLANIQAGYYPMDHARPGSVLRAMGDYFKDLPKVHNRRKARNNQEGNGERRPGISSAVPALLPAEFSLSK